jgi:hypothetical protein
MPFRLLPAVANLIEKNVSSDGFDLDYIGCVPLNFVIGLAKTGTSAFYAYLSTHPRFVNLGKKEQDLFNK